MNKNKLTGNSRTQNRQSPQSPAPSCAPPATTNTKDNGGKDALPASNADSGQLSTKGKAVFDFFLKLADQKNPSAEDVARLRQQIVSIPDVWPLATVTMPTIRESLIEKTAGRGAVRALLLAEVDILAKQLGYDAAPPLERLLIELVLTARLRVMDAEGHYNNCVVNESISVNAAEFWDNLLSSTQARLLRAIETLARVRRLARNTPALQINIAREGGKQVNVQGDAPASSEHPVGGS